VVGGAEGAYCSAGSGSRVPHGGLLSPPPTSPGGSYNPLRGVS
jgi:hypothetical protein